MLLPNGTNINHELVKEDWCWWYWKYAPLDTELEALEKSARIGKKGLWVDPTPIPLWVYRRAKRGQALDLSDLVPLESETKSGAAPRGPPLPGAVQLDSSPETASSSYLVIGNRRSHIYYRPDCPNYSQVAVHNRVAFNSAADAEQAGYRVTGNCP